MTLEMPDVEEEQKPKKGRTAEEKKAAQAAAHKRWRESDKGKAWIAAYKQSAKYKADQKKLQEERKSVNEQG